ncbi:MAG: MFS transporter, partial [Nakamurella sp.]
AMVPTPWPLSRSRKSRCRNEERKVGVLGLILLSGNGPLVATCAAVLLFGAAAMLAGKVRLPRPNRPDGTGTAFAEMLDGIRVVAKRAKVRRPMTVAVIDNFLYGYLVVAIVVLADQMFGGEQAIGWLNAGLSVGALTAMLVVNRLAGPNRPASVLFTVMAVFAVATAVTGLSGWLPITVAMVAVAGASTLVAEVIAVTLLQRSAPDALVARVFGVYDQLNVGAIAVGSLIAGPLADALGPQLAIVLVAVGCLVAATAATSRLTDRANRLGRHAAQRFVVDPVG